MRQSPGSRIIETTKDASHLIAESLVVRRGVLRDNRDAVSKLLKGWVQANAVINASPGTKRTAIRLMARSFSTSPQLAEREINTVQLATHGDNLNFFGINKDYKGEKGEDLFNYFWSRYRSLGNMSSSVRPEWNSIADASIINALSLEGREHRAERAPDFSRCASHTKLRNLANKSLSVYFDRDDYSLSAGSREQIREQFGHLAEIYFHDCIRIDGNTDSTGDRNYNIWLSKKRAESVKNYLVERYEFSPARIIVVGHGVWSKNSRRSLLPVRKNRLQASRPFRSPEDCILMASGR